jgi:NADPH2:quinone reductase
VKAIRIEKHGGPEVMGVADVPPPAPREGQLVVKIAAAGVNFADVMQRQGTYPVPQRLPMTLGFEVAGTIAALGPGVEGPAVGTRVIALVKGGYAEYALARAESVVEIPDAIDFPRAAAIFVQGATAELLLRAARVSPGKSVLIHAAAGGVGVFAVQLARAIGARPIIATASRAEKLDLCRSLGADEGVDYSRDDWRARVSELTSGRGVDVVLDMVGGQIGAESAACLAPFGCIALFGMAGGTPTAIDPIRLMFMNQTAVGFTLTGIPPAESAASARRLVARVGEGALKVLVGQTLPLERAAQAHQALSERRAVGKVVLTVG